MGFWRVAPDDAVLVAVKVQPRARRPGLAGRMPAVGGERLRIAVAEPAEGGRANRAACALMAAALGLPAVSVAVAAGAASREKTLRIDGDKAAIVARLEAL
jgi:uncharacterized protein (TIGR00251 family)